MKGKHAINQIRFLRKSSAILCQVACEVADECSCIDDEKILSTVHNRRLKVPAKNNLAVDDCNATALIAVVDAKNIWAYRLGDGFICIAADDKAIALFDYKEEKFINVTECLRTEFDFGNWE